MIDVAAIFKNKSLDADKLTAFGFKPVGGEYRMDFPIMRGQFFARVSISADGAAAFKVYDTETNDEYPLANVPDAAGAFVGEVNNECEAVLKSVADKCFYAERFKWEQSKRILRHIKEAYNAEPEFLWSKFPDFAAIRVLGKKPWFAVIGIVGKDKFGLTEGGLAEIINLKDEPRAVADRINERKAFPAYHMNKKNWYSVFMDGSLTDEKIAAFIEKSYRLVNS